MKQWRASGSRGLALSDVHLRVDLWVQHGPNYQATEVMRLFDFLDGLPLRHLDVLESSKETSIPI